METMKSLQALTDWKLLAGSHEFPGPSGGTCINEAALVAAGFPYCAVRNATDMPACFSQPISEFAIGLNDMMNDEERKALTPFVVRLAGTADRPGIEAARAKYVVTSLINVVIARMMKRVGRSDLAAICARARTLEEIHQAAADARAAAYATDDATDAARAAAYAARTAAEARADARAAARDAAYAARTAAYARDAASAAARAAANAAHAADAADAADAASGERNFVVRWGIGALEGMLAIGAQAEPIEVSLVVARMDAIMAAARERTITT